jgi:hypothetical protein
VTRVDSVLLSGIIVDLLDRSMDLAYTPDERREFLAIAKRLRGALLNLLTAVFEEATPELSAANAQLAAVSEQLQRNAASIDRVADDMGAAAALVGTLDSLLGIAAHFL